MAANPLDGFNEIYKGDTWVLPFEFTHVVSGVSVAVDIIGWRLTLTLKALEAAADVDAAISITTVCGQHPNDNAAQGKMTIEADFNLTQLVAAAQYEYDIERRIPRAGRPDLVTTIFRGRVKVLEDVTDNGG